MIIAVDAAGGGHAPREIIKGAIQAVQEHRVGITVVGNKTMLHVLAGKHLRDLNITITEASQVIDFHDYRRIENEYCGSD